MLNRRELPARWEAKLKTYISEVLKHERGWLTTSAFTHIIKITFPDGSFAFFNYAFYLLDRESKEIAVFTEHCGYHIFPLPGTEIELFKSEGVDLNDDEDGE